MITSQFQMKLIWIAGMQMKLRCDHRSCDRNLSNYTFFSLFKPWHFFQAKKHMKLIWTAGIQMKLRCDHRNLLSNYTFFSLFKPWNFFQAKKHMKLVWTAGILMKLRCDHRNLSNYKLFLACLRRGYTRRLFWRRLTRPFCQYLSHVLSNANSLCLFP